MVDRNDPDSSESSQPPTPTRTLSEYKPHFMTSDSSLPRPELELSISLIDRQRSVSAMGMSMIPFTSLQERDVPSKEPLFYPDLLSRMEASQQVNREALCMLATALARPSGTPPLTVVLEEQLTGRRISLQDYNGYDNFAAAMKTIFDSHMLRRDVSSQEAPPDEENCNLMNAIPGYAIAYKDEKGDVVIAGTIPWRDFVRMAKQIRIVPVIDLR